MPVALNPAARRSRTRRPAPHPTSRICISLLSRSAWANLAIVNLLGEATAFRKPRFLMAKETTDCLSHALRPRFDPILNAV